MRKLLTPFGLKPKIIDPNAPRYADIYSRSVAMAIDLLPLMALFAAPVDRLMMMVYHAFGKTLPDAHTIQNGQQLFQAMWDVRYPWLLNNLMVFLLFAIPYVGCQMIYGTTPGRWLLGLKIVKRDDHSQTPTRGGYVIRYLAYIASLAPLMIGMMWAGFNKERRTWHDMIAGTVVLNTRKPGWTIDQAKRLLRGKPADGSSAPVEDAVGEPAAEQRHEDSNKPVE